MYRLKQAFQLSSSLDQDNCLLKDMCVLSCSVVPDSLLPMDCSPLGSSVHWILQERILEWVAISFSRGSSWPKDQTHVSCIGKRVLYLWATKEAPTQRCMRIHVYCASPLSFPGGANGKEPACQCRRHKRHGFSPWVRRILAGVQLQQPGNQPEGVSGVGGWWCTLWLIVGNDMFISSFRFLFILWQKH